MSEYKPEYVKKDDFIAAKRWLYCEYCERREGKKNGKQTVLYEIGEAPCRSCRLNDMLEEFEDYPASAVVPAESVKELKALAEKLLAKYQNAETACIWEYSGDIEKSLADLKIKIRELQEEIDRAAAGIFGGKNEG